MAGRPTKYKKEYCQEIIDFFESEPKTIGYKRTYFMSGALKSEEPTARWFPTFQGFARSIGVDLLTLERWRDKHPEFRSAYARAKEIQEEIWLQESLSGRFNAQFAKFFGVNCLGYKDKVEQETTITDYSMTFEGKSKKEVDEITG